jgi:hypothetical protein
MSRGPCTFRQTDVARALRAARAAGLVVDKVEIDRAGKIVIVAAKGDIGFPENPFDERNPWDEVLTNASHEKRPS